MTDYIDRQAAMDAIHNHYEARNPIQNALMDEVSMLIFRLPPADVRPVVRGRWEIRAYGIDGEDVYCSACECGSSKPYWPFCPMCGADMRGGESDG